MAEPLPEEIIGKAREFVLCGRSKHSIAKELGLSDMVVYYHTRDIPSKNPGRTEIRGKTLDVLKTLLT